MTTAPRLQLGLDEYLSASFRPDCDFVNGEVQERNLGELDHSLVQMAVLDWFLQHEPEWNLLPLPEIRLQISETRYRVADIAVLDARAPRKQVLTTPPRIVIEILSPEDRVTRYLERLDDYRLMGVPPLWVINPITRKGYDCSSGNWIETGTFHLPGTTVSLPVAMIAARLDAQPTWP
jgi:Uma2 family endonuclease